MRVQSSILDAIIQTYVKNIFYQRILVQCPIYGTNSQLFLFLEVLKVPNYLT